MTKEELINRVLTEWATDFIGDAAASARSKLGTDTGAGGNSFDVNVVRAAANQSAAVIVSFNSYLRYFDMSNRNLRRDGDLSPEAIEDTKEWVRRNLSKLMAGYKGQTAYVNKATPYPVSRIINAIAWGISKKKKRPKRRQWYSKLKGERQYKLYYQLLDELLPMMLSEVKSRVIGDGL